MDLENLPLSKTKNKKNSDNMKKSNQRPYSHEELMDINNAEQLTVEEVKKSLSDGNFQKNIKAIHFSLNHDELNEDKEKEYIKLLESLNGPQGNIFLKLGKFKDKDELLDFFQNNYDKYQSLPIFNSEEWHKKVDEFELSVKNNQTIQSGFSDYIQKASQDLQEINNLSKNDRIVVSVKMAQEIQWKIIKDYLQEIYHYQFIQNEFIENNQSQIKDIYQHIIHNPLIDNYILPQTKKALFESNIYRLDNFKDFSNIRRWFRTIIDAKLSNIKFLSMDEDQKSELASFDNFFTSKERVKGNVAQYAHYFILSALSSKPDLETGRDLSSFSKADAILNKGFDYAYNQNLLFQNIKSFLKKYNSEVKPENDLYNFSDKDILVLEQIMGELISIHEYKKPEEYLGIKDAINSLKVINEKKVDKFNKYFDNQKDILSALSVIEKHYQEEISAILGNMKFEDRDIQNYYDQIKERKFSEDANTQLKVVLNMVRDFSYVKLLELLQKNDVQNIPPDSIGLENSIKEITPGQEIEINQYS